MSKDSKNSTVNNYYLGGLAELVVSPSKLTFSFLKDWFTGKGSLGKAMRLLNLPYEKTAESVLVLKDNELLVDLKAEEESLYKNTVFKYRQQTSIQGVPQLSIDLRKLINPLCLINTLIILFVQSKWIANSLGVINTAKSFVDNIPSEAKGYNLQQVDAVLMDKVWPNIIAVGLLSEFYNQLLIKEAGKEIVNVNNYISSVITQKDWFFRSIADQLEVKNKNLSFADFISRYSVRADKDYEITCPRWHEIKDVIKKRINSVADNNVHPIKINVNSKLKRIIDSCIELQLLRSEAKRKSLVHLDYLREIILKTGVNQNSLSNLAKEDLLDGKISKDIIGDKKKPEKKLSVVKILSGKGISVCPGIAEGITRNIGNNDIDIAPGTIGIFPNASPEFAIQYPKCRGMIFLRGGQTSHGAIVAREFKIPSIIDSKANGIKDGVKININGETGEWKAV
jgi:phosphohistidine swiveling domain-containing protein